MAEDSASSKLDNMGKEDLVKLIKKYIVLQKHLKTKNQDLSNKLQAAEELTADTNGIKPKEVEEENCRKNDHLRMENSQLKLQIETQTKDIETLQTTVDEYEKFKLEICPQLENARQEIDLNKSMLDILNNEIEMLNSDKLLLEKRLFNTRRNVTPCIIVEEDEEDLEEEKRNENGQNLSSEYIPDDRDDLYESYVEDNEEAINGHNHDIMQLNNGPRTNDGILILNKQIEDLTFYCDELKSELEVEREKTNEYLNEIKSYRVQVEDFEQQNEFNSLESSSIHECLKKANNEKELIIKQLENKIQNSGGSENENIEKFLVIFCDELLEKKNFEFFKPGEMSFGVEFEKIEEVVKKLKEFNKRNEDRVSKEMVKGFEAQKNFETQMERVIRDFRAEINIGEEKFNVKQTEINELKLKNLADSKIVQDELATEKNKSKDTHKEISKNKMLDLEIADYERSIKNLNLQSLNKDKQISDFQKQIDDLNLGVNNLKSEYERVLKEKETSNEKSTKLKHLLIKAKKEVADAQDHEHKHLSNDIELKTQIEGCNSEIENYKMLLATSEADSLKSKEKLDRLQGLNGQEMNTLETRLNSIEVERDDLNGQLTRLKNEYDKYKLKVQQAFKKQKESALVENNNDGRDLVEGDGNDVQMFRERNELLGRRLEEEAEKVGMLERENENIREEFTKSLQRNTKLLGDLKEREAEWRIKNEDLIKNNNLTKSKESEELTRSFAIEREAISLNFKEKLRALGAESNSTILDLQTYIDEFKEKIADLNRQLGQLREKNAALESNAEKSLSVSVTSNSSHKDGGSNFMRLTPQKSFDLTNNFILRQVENIDRSLDENKSNHSNTSKTIEQLLNEPTPNSPASNNNHHNNNSNTNNTSHSDLNILQHQMEVMRGEMEKGKLQLIHLNELLNESESTNSRLTDQINVLKDEIRRLERNQEREKSIANMEYLKNVVYKFLTFTNSEEKTQLLPVLSTMLKLSPAEQTAIMNTKIISASATNDASWSTYLPKWT